MTLKPWTTPSVVDRLEEEVKLHQGNVVAFVLSRY